MKSIGYYPGCSLSGTAAEYDRSLHAVALRLGWNLQEVPEWVCCGATSAHALDHHAALCLAADTLLKARKTGMDAVLAPCAMCYSRLATAAHELHEKPGLSATIAGAMGESADLRFENVQAVNVISWLADVMQGDAAAAITRPLTGLKVACYYGCLLVRPPKITGENDVEVPRSMERLVQKMGAEPVRWSMALECCGGSFALSRKQVVLRQGRRIYDAARAAGADVMCLACPMCHSNIDMRQTEFGVTGNDRMPIVYLTQLLGLAMGMDSEALGFAGHFVPVEPLVGAKIPAGA